MIADGMRRSPHGGEGAQNPFQFVVIALAGWMNQRQQNVIGYLREENRIESCASNSESVACGSRMSPKATSGDTI